MIHHICLQKHSTICDGKAIPFGEFSLLEDIEGILPAMLDAVIPEIQKEGDVVICGNNPARRILGRKIEDTLKRKVTYE